jgi:AcrR family transcriptional regulator
LFSERGFESTSLRAISREAGVDPALVHHFFDGKAAVFNAAFADVVKPWEIFDEEFGEDVPDVGERLVGRFLSIWEQQETRDALLAMLRSSIAHAHAAELLGEFMTDDRYGRSPRTPHRRTPRCAPLLSARNSSGSPCCAT